MAPVIRAIVCSAIAQMAILVLLVGYLFVHADNMSQKYAAMTLQSAHEYTDEQDVSTRQYIDQQNQRLYNALQVQFSNEREGMHAWIDKRIDLKLAQPPKEYKQ